MNQIDVGLWGMIGTWFAGIITGIVGLLPIFIKKHKIKLKCRITEKDLIVLDTKEKLATYLVITIINISDTPVNIEKYNSIGMISKKIKLKFWKKGKIWTLVSQGRHNGVTTSLGYGETYQSEIELKDDWYIKTATLLYYSGYQPSEMECYVYVNNSIKYRFPFDDEVMKKLKTAYKKIASNY